MKVKKNCIEKVQDWADDKLRQMCGVSRREKG